MMRFILSIIAGLFISAILATVTDHVFHITNIYPPYGEPFLDHGLLLLAFTYRALFCLLAAYITAIIAREKAMRAVVVLGVIGSLLWLAGTIATWDQAQPWYNVAGVITGVPFTWLAGKLYQHKRKQLRTT